MLHIIFKICYYCIQHAEVVNNCIGEENNNHKLKPQVTCTCAMHLDDCEFHNFDYVET